MTDANSHAAGPAIMAGFPPPPGARVTLENWDRPPFNRWSFLNVRQVLPTRAVGRGTGPVHEFPRDHQALERVTFTDSEGVETTVGSLIARTWTDGVLILHRGRIVMERYFNGMTAATPHLSQSVAKSLVGTTAGILIGRGVLDPRAPLADTVPELTGSGYADAMLEHVLDMTSGVRFTEVYDDPASDVHRIDRACGWKPRESPDDPDCLYDLLATLPKEREHGEGFRYRSVETDVLAWVMERATGTHLTDLVSRELWSQLGCEHDASFAVDRAGTAMADGGLNATLRDYARFGEMHRQGGLFAGRQIAPAQWVAACRVGDHSRFGAPYTDVLPNGAYRNQFWIGDVDRGDYMARGVFGQLIYIDPAADMVGVKLSTWPDYQNPGFLKDTLAALRAVGRELSGG